MVSVSVIIPTHDRNDLLVRSIRSVLAQSSPVDEIIVVDDSGTAESIIQDINAKIHYIKIPQTPNPAVSRNAGIRHATGDVIAFLDDDDEWLEDMIKTELEFLSIHPETALVSTDAWVRRNPPDATRPQTRYLNDSAGRNGLLFNALLLNNTIITSTCMVRRDVLQEMAGFSEDPAYRGIEDYELWLRIGRIYPVAYLPKALAIYQDAPDSLRSRISRLKYYDGLYRMYRDLSAKKPAIGENTQIPRILRTVMIDTTIRRLCWIFYTENKTAFLSALKQDLFSSPTVLPRLLLCLIRTGIAQQKHNR